MKQTLLVIAMGILIASCGTGGGDQTANLQKQIDSLVKLVPAGKPGLATTAKFAEGMAPAQQYSVAPAASNYLVMSAIANRQIQEWHNTLKNGRPINWNVNKGRTAFLVPAKTLDTLINSLGCQYVVFYFGIDKDGTDQISLYYTGVQQTDDTTINEIEITNAAGAKCVFDLSYPCPKCDKIGIHVPSAGIGGQPPATIFSMVDNNNGNLNGIINPDGNKSYYNNAAATYTFTPNAGYKVDKVTIDGIETPTNGQNYTFTNFTGSHEIKVKFKSIK